MLKEDRLTPMLSGLRLTLFILLVLGFPAPLLRLLLLLLPPVRRSVVRHRLLLEDRPHLMMFATSSVSRRRLRQRERHLRQARSKRQRNRLIWQGQKLLTIKQQPVHLPVVRWCRLGLDLMGRVWRVACPLGRRERRRSLHRSKRRR